MSPATKFRSIRGLSRRIRYAVGVVLVAGLLVLVRHTFARQETTDAAASRSSSMEIRTFHDRYEIRLDGETLTTFTPPTLGGQPPEKVAVELAGSGWERVRLTWNPDKDVPQDELAIWFDVDFAPDFWWAPHLAPRDGFVIAQHVFRSPAVVARRGGRTLVIVPDLDLVGDNAATPWFLDVDAPKNRIRLGMTRTSIPIHVLYKEEPGMVVPKGRVQIGFYVSAYKDTGNPGDPWGEATKFLWDRWARPLYQKGEPAHAPLERYVKRTYDWAFDLWKDSVWQEFELGGRKVGAPQFIVNQTRSPDYKGEWYQREYLSVWNQAWFSSLRSASGLYRYARRTGNKDLLEKARLTKELALSAPMKDGLFPSVLRVDNIKVMIDGKKRGRPKGWDTAYWINSNRCPYDHGINEKWYHVLDASWTCLQMLRWYEDLEQDPRLLEYAKRYAAKLLTLQDKDGFFPGWLNPDTLKPGPVMNQTPESAVSATFLFTLAKITGEKRYREAALRCVDALLVEVVPDGRWEDFETYWSCSPWGRDRYLGKRIPRNAMFKKNTLSMFWTAEALLEAYRTTKNSLYLAWGRRVLDELSMFQQVWQPPFIHVPSLGGFGVMNCDGEWNDSRQSLFAELFLEYSKATGDTQLFERGIAAMKAGFIMMYCPENPIVKKQWEKRYPWFGPKDYGFTMENYAHGGSTHGKEAPMGDFTIYDWGNGAAAEAYERIRDHFGKAIDDPSQ